MIPKDLQCPWAGYELVKDFVRKQLCLLLHLIKISILYRALPSKFPAQGVLRQNPNSTVLEDTQGLSKHALSLVTGQNLKKKRGGVRPQREIYFGPSGEFTVGKARAPCAHGERFSCAPLLTVRMLSRRLKRKWLTFHTTP